MRISDWSSDVYSSDLKPARGASFAPAPPPDVAPDPALSAPGAYEMVTGQAQLDAWIERLRAADEFAVDTETDSLDAMRANLVGMSFCIEPGVACYIPLAHDYPGMPEQLDRAQVLAALAPLFADASVKKLGQHGKYDLHVLRRHGVEVAGYADDTMLESFVLESGRSEEHTSELQSLMRISYAVFCLKKK